MVVVVGCVIMTGDTDVWVVHCLIFDIYTLLMAAEIYGGQIHDRIGIDQEE